MLLDVEERNNPTERQFGQYFPLLFREGCGESVASRLFRRVAARLRRQSGSWPGRTVARQSKPGHHRAKQAWPWPGNTPQAQMISASWRHPWNL